MPTRPTSLVYPKAPENRPAREPATGRQDGGLLRADAPKQASLIAEEQSKRRADSINSPINCTSTATGTTVYTRCQ